jgi:hypothetical protein
MAELLPLPPFEILKFLEDVAKDSKVPLKMAEEIRKILSKSPENGKMSSSDLYRIVEILRDRRKLLQQFNKFIKGHVGPWRDSQGLTHLYGDFTDAILVFPSKNVTTKPEAKAEIIQAAFQFERKVLSKVKEQDRDRIQDLIQGKTTSHDDLNLAVAAIANGKTAWDEELQDSIIMFGRLLPGHGVDGISNRCLVDVWTQVSCDNEGELPRKIIVFYSPGKGWSFREREKMINGASCAGKKRKPEEKIDKGEDTLVL